METARNAPDSETARALVRALCEHVFWLKSVHLTYVELFETERAGPILRRTAHAFFSDMNQVLVEYLFLSIARITDPVRTGEEENFSVPNLLATINWRADLLPRLEELNGVLQQLRQHMKPARNKLVAHLDKNTFIGGDDRLGAFPAGMDSEGIQALEEICNLFHKECFGQISGSMSVGVVGDAGDLKSWLARGLAFDELIREAKGAEKIRLYKLMEKWRGVGAAPDVT